MLRFIICSVLLVLAVNCGYTHHQNQKIQQELESLTEQRDALIRQLQLQEKGSELVGQLKAQESQMVEKTRTYVSTVEAAVAAVLDVVVDDELLRGLRTYDSNAAPSLPASTPSSR